jgi:hypothetical protein
MMSVLCHNTFLYMLNLKFQTCSPARSPSVWSEGWMGWSWKGLCANPGKQSIWPGMVILYQSSNVLLSSIHENGMQDYTIAQPSGPVNSCPSPFFFTFLYRIWYHILVPFYIILNLFCVFGRLFIREKLLLQKHKVTCQ